MTLEIVKKITNESLEKAKLVLENDGVIILPTDTNYNLICNPNSKKAIDRIFEIKGRAQDKPLSLFFANPIDWMQYGTSQNNDAASKVIEHFWPGPLNIILKKTTLVPNHILYREETVALGCISNPIWQRVVSYYGRPITLTSANKSGTANNILVTEEMALEQVSEEVDMFFIGSPIKNTTKSSTIIDFTGNHFNIVRHGDITAESIQEAIDG